MRRYTGYDENGDPESEEAYIYGGTGEAVIGVGIIFAVLLLTLGAVSLLSA